MHIHISAIKETDWPAWEQRWRALETAAQTDFFRGASFLFCQAPARFGDAHMVCAQEGDQDVALAICNRGRNGRLYLHESGDAVWDNIFIEYNGPIVRHGFAHALPALLAKTLELGAIRLSGITLQVAAACAGLGRLPAPQTRIARRRDLTSLADGILAEISANSRAQISRAQRLEGGEASFTPANSPAEAAEFLRRLIDLHQAHWQARHHPGAFADSRIREFHLALLARGFDRGEITIARIASPSREIGYLYLLINSGHVMAYQSGLAPAPGKHHKPGLIAHLAAISHFARNGFQFYDFLAGDAQYKRTLAPDLSETLIWGTLYPQGSIEGAARTLGGSIKRRLGMSCEAK